MLGPFGWVRQKLGYRMGYRHLSSDIDQHEIADETGPSQFHDDVEAKELESTPKSRRWKLAIIGRHIKKLIVLLPSFLHPRDPDKPPRGLHSTSWLDGLRGVAAFFVVWHHISLVFFPWDLHNGWTSPNDPVIRFPIVRLAISGLPNVMVFFAVSGYALSYKPLSLLRQGRLQDAHQALASSAFRRHPRLFVPAVALCLPCVLVAHLGLYGGGERMPGAAVATLGPPRRDTLWRQLLDYGGAVARLCDPFAGDGVGWVYNDALWTLPVEFRGSLVVFGLLLAVSRLRDGVRLLVVFAVVVYCLCFAHWAEFLFVGGVLLADLRLCFSGRGDGCGGCGDTEAKTRCCRSRVVVSAALRWWRCAVGCRVLQIIASLLSFLGALYLLGMPKLERGGAETPGFEFLARLIPERWRAAGSPDHFWPSIAAVWLVLSVDRAPFLQRVFTCRFAQYLGRISYSLYLVHLVILHSFGFWLGKYFVGLAGSDSELHYFAGVLAAAAVFWLISVWAADLGWRFVDAKVVRFASWVYNRLCKNLAVS
ncbi:acyltransferase family-domain-containing protein [Hypoxylon sp. FL0543]|nr:acyltransferase family-domain-containing protein [Hypoxylon sp. FL0543]